MMRGKLAVLCLLSACAAQAQSLPAANRTVGLILVSAVGSKLPSGASFQARLAAPVPLDAQTLLPKGTLFEGHVETVRARRRLRSGSLRLVFDRIVMPDGSICPARVTLSSVSYAKVKTDSEGIVHPRLSRKRLAFQLGGTALIAKAADDISELASASVTKNSARYFGLAGAVTFLLLQKGGEVKVPQGTEIEVTLDRSSEVLPLNISPEPASPPR